MLWGNGNSKVSPMNGPKVSQTYGFSYGLTRVGARDAYASNVMKMKRICKKCMKQEVTKWNAF